MNILFWQVSFWRNKVSVNCVIPVKVMNIIHDVLPASNSREYWEGIRDSWGRSENPNWYSGMWDFAWEEYVILASSTLEKEAVL